MADNSILPNYGGTDIPRLVDKVKVEINTAAEAFYRVGSRLAELKDEFKQLGGPTKKAAGGWDGLLEREFGIKRAYASQIINAALTYENLKNVCDRKQILPSGEWQIRPISKHHKYPADQVEAWNIAVELADGGQPTEAHVKQATVVQINRRLGRPDDYKPEPDHRPKLKAFSKVTPQQASILKELVKIGYRKLSTKYHPDKEGGSTEMMADLNAVKELILKSIPK